MKTVIGTAAAGAMTISAAAPAMARDHRHHDGNGIGTGEVIAGALILGGIAAVIAASDNDKDNRYYDRRYRDRNDRHYRDRYRGGYSARGAIERCVRAAESTASRYTRSRADVTEIRDVDRKRDGFKIKGNLTVSENYGRHRNYGYRDNYDRGRFTCRIERGRVVDIDFHGIRGL
ncbi:hypothetical protein [Altericroceibacterium spongiae]|nr:hypothetical protein [Altericroceibacterium spongiae]